MVGFTLGECRGEPNPLTSKAVHQKEHTLISAPSLAVRNHVRPIDLTH